MLKPIAPARDTAADTAALLDRDREALSSSLDAQSHRAAELRRARRADDHERRVGLPRETRQPHRDRARDRGGRVEHHERERAAAQQHVGAPGTTCRVARGESLRLFYADAQGTRYETFERLQKSLASQRRRLVFAMNAGMFHPDMKPVGLLVIDGHELAAINRATGSGNFYLQPNGVFQIDKKGSRVLATDEYRESTPAFATQSGPMLLHRGQIAVVE